MSIDKMRTRVFLTSNLTVTGTATYTGAAVMPYGTSAPTLATNGMIAVANVGGTTRLVIKSGGTTYTLVLGTAVAGGSITLTSV